MKNSGFLLLVLLIFFANVQYAQELVPTINVDPKTEMSDQGNPHKSIKDQGNSKKIQRDTLSNTERLILSEEYQALDHSPVIVVVTHEGHTYTGSRKGINFCDGSSNNRITTENAKIPEDNITALALDTDDNLWIGTNSHGIVKGTGYPVKPFKTKIITTRDLHIFSIVADKRGEMWVTYRNGGYEYFKEGVSLAYFPVLK